MGAVIKAEQVFRARHLTMCKPPSKGQVDGWLRGLGTDEAQPVLTVKGPTPRHRTTVLDWCRPPTGRDPHHWIAGGVQEHFITELSQLGQEWGILWNLLDVEEFFVDEPLLSLVNQGLLFTEFYQTLWETRFLLQESAPEVDKLVDSVVRWMTAGELTSDHRQYLNRVRISREVTSDSERLDLLFFLVALANQNAALNRPVVVVYDGLEQAMGQSPPKRRKLLTDLLQLIEAAERWNKLGAALGVVVGLPDTSACLRLEGYNPQLHAKIDCEPV